METPNCPKQRMIREQNGATAVEYAILCSLIAGVVVAVVALLGVTVQGLFSSAVW